MSEAQAPLRLTHLARGGGCACKFPPGELESMLRRFPSFQATNLLVGLENGDDATVVGLDETRAVIATADFFTPVVDNPYDWGSVAAANALSDVYAMGGEPLVAISLMSWPRELLPLDAAAEVLRGGDSVARLADCPLSGGHTVDGPEPVYGLAVTGLVDPSQLLRNDAGKAGCPLTLTKPLGLGVLNNRHKVTGERFQEAIDTMTTLNRDAGRAALISGARCATDVTGFGLLGHLYKMVRASRVTAVIEAGTVPYLEAARPSLAAGFVPGGSRRNLEWVRPQVDSRCDEDELVLLADAQTSGGLLIAGEVPGYPVIGELVERRSAAIVVV
jgi:selenide,water dikinase